MAMLREAGSGAACAMPVQAPSASAVAAVPSEKQALIGDLIGKQPHTHGVTSVVGADDGAGDQWSKVEPPKVNPSERSSEGAGGVKLRISVGQCEHL